MPIDRNIDQLSERAGRMARQLVDVSRAIVKWDMWLANERRPAELRRQLPRPAFNREDLEELRAVLVAEIALLDETGPENIDP